MAFEVFDDVAFYWFFQVILGIFLVPLTFSRVRTWLTGHRKRKTRSHPVVKSIPDYIPTQKLVEDEIDSRFSLSAIFFTALWVMFILMLIQLPKWHNREMTNFEPYEILGIDRGVTEQQIKRAYRKQSLLNHPDKKCVNSPDPDCKNKAQDVFILISKAYQALTNEETRKNYEQYGNPDGYQGTMVTIGLPSFLTHKDNELVILLFYFLSLIILVGLAWFWWSRTSKFHKSGVYKQSIDIYWRYIKHNMNSKRLVDILAASSEYRIMDVKIPSDPTHPKMKDLNKIGAEIARRSSGNRARKDGGGNAVDEDYIFEAPYVRKAASLLTAHLMGLSIPPGLHDEYLFVLQEAPHLLDVMIDMTLSRERYFAQGLQLIGLKQSIVQGVWSSDTHFKQLPHWSIGLERSLRTQQMNSLHDLNKMGPEKLRETLTKAYKKQMDVSHLLVKDGKPSQQSEKKEDESADAAAKPSDLPAAGIEEVDEEEVLEMVQHGEAMVRMYPVVQMQWCARTYDEVDVFTGDIVTVTVELERVHQPWELDFQVFKAVSEMTPPEREKRSKLSNDENEEKKNQYSEEHGLDFVDSEMDEKKRLQIQRLNAPVVHVNRFPFRVREKWMIMLVDKLIPAVVDQCAVPALTAKKHVELHFRVNRQRPGKHPYLLVAKCDSYLGADRAAEFVLDIKEPPPDMQRKDDEKPDYEIGEVEEYEADPKWYYLWNETWWEFVLTLFLLYFIYLIIVSTTWGKNWVQPCVDWFYEKAVAPVTAVLHSSLAPVMRPMLKTVLDYTGWDVAAWWSGVETEKDEDDDIPGMGED